MPFWEAPLATLDHGQWEALCDGCGKCCLHKLEDEDSGRIYPTNVACRLLDLATARCGDYKHRRRHVPDCLTLTRARVDDLEWLPQSCAYRLRAEGQPLPDWHYLVCGDRDAVHRAGQSIVGWTVGEDVAGPLENHLVERVV
ncbi:MAG: YcgN family cysteine cluster protein [Alphaproteobacteria bacterium HGW-Alphaproteobacteria-13]|nr:MAG: YcgN family cysteine cluster protein [Alphaproteobacteria bacterium HGW-Alphaproteobacteria-13]